MAAGSLIYVGKSRLRRQVKKSRQISKPKGSKSKKRGSLSSRGSSSSNGSSGRSSPSLRCSTLSLLNPEHQNGDNVLENTSEAGNNEEVAACTVKCEDEHCCKFCADNAAADDDDAGFTEKFFKGLNFSSTNLSPGKNQYKALQQQDPEEELIQTLPEPQNPDAILPDDIFQGTDDSQDATEPMLPPGEKSQHENFEGYVLLDDEDVDDEEEDEIQAFRTVGTQYEQFGVKDASMGEKAAKQMKKLMKKNPCCTIM